LELVRTFWTRTKKHRKKVKINKQDYIKLKSLFTAKETINRVKNRSSEWAKIYSSHAFEKRLILRTYEELNNLSNTRANIFF
jgi:hypothetical protein